MAKGKKSAKSLTDDWIKQVVTGQRHKLAHYADGDYVEKDEPTPEPAPETPRPIDAIPADKGSTVDQLRSYGGKMDQALKDAGAYANGGFIPHLADGLFVDSVLKPQGFPDVSSGEARAGINPTYPAVSATAVSAPSADIRTKIISYDQAQELTRQHNAQITENKARAAAAADQPKPRRTVYGDTYADGGHVKRMEKGGDVDGPGTGTSDSVPAMLSDGEYVLPADTVDAVGKATLDKLKNATHTPVHKPKMKGMVTMRADGGEIDEQTKADRNSILSGAGHLAAAAGDIASQPVSIVGSAYNNLIARPARAVGVPLPNTSWNVGNYGATPLTDYMYGADGRGPQPLAPAPTSTTTPAPEPTPAPAATEPVAPAPEAAKPITAPNFMPTMSSPNTAQDMGSEGRNLMNTQGIGGFVQAKGLNRMAQTVNQTNEPLIRGQYELQNTAMTANERLEQAKLVEHQRQQNLATWTPDRNMMGELLGYGRTKGGTPQYVTKESLMPKPAIAEGTTGKDAHNRPVVYKNGTWVAKQ
jgi:hypothetical protein